MTRVACAPESLKAAVRDISAGSICTLVTLSYALGFAVMIFGGELQRFLPLGMPTLLVSCVAVGAIVSLASPMRFTIAAPDSNSVAVLAVAVAGIAASVRATGGGDQIVLTTVLCALAASAFVTGVVAYALGALRLGTVIQLMPYSVVAGFIAGTGFLIVAGAFQIATGRKFDLAAHQALIQAHPIAVATTLAVATVLLGSSRLRGHFLGLPAVVVLGTAGFYAAALGIGLSRDQLLNLGLISGPAAITSLTPTVALALPSISLAAIAAHTLDLLSAVLIAIITILLNTTGIEVATGKDVDANAELRATGLANIVTGMLGGTIGHLSMSRSLLNFRAGATTRFAGLWAAGLCLMLTLAWPDAVGFLPKPVLAGLLLYLGISMLMDAALRSRHKLPLYEYALVLMILALIATQGFLAGVGLGIIGASLLFAWNYGRVSCIKSVFTGANQRSRVRRPIHEQKVLNEHHGALFGMRLQGYLFFGTARSIVTRATDAMRDRDRSFILLDLRAVQGIDASTLLSFQKIKQHCGAGTAVIFSGMVDEIREQLRRGGILDPTSTVFADLDHALEFVEGQILASHGARRPGSALRKMLGPYFQPQNLERLLFLLQPLDLQAGHVVFRSGERGEALLFIEGGQLSIRTAADGGVRLASYGPGTIVGETALFGAEPHPADVIAQVPSRVFRLGADKLRELERTSPAAALELKTLVIQSLVLRLGAANREINALES